MYKVDQFKSPEYRFEFAEKFYTWDMVEWYEKLSPVMATRDLEKIWQVIRGVTALDLDRLQAVGLAQDFFTAAEKELLPALKKVFGEQPFSQLSMVSPPIPLIQQLVEDSPPVSP